MRVKSVTVQYLVQASVWREYWVNLGERGGKDGVFQGLAGLLQRIS